MSPQGSRAEFLYRGDKGLEERAVCRCHWRRSSRKRRIERCHGYRSHLLHNNRWRCLKRAWHPLDDGEHRRVVGAYYLFTLIVFAFCADRFSSCHLNNRKLTSGIFWCCCHHIIKRIDFVDDAFRIVHPDAAAIYITHREKRQTKTLARFSARTLRLWLTTSSHLVIWTLRREIAPADIDVAEVSN